LAASLEMVGIDGGAAASSDTEMTTSSFSGCDILRTTASLFAVEGVLRLAASLEIVGIDGGAAASSEWEMTTSSFSGGDILRTTASSLSSGEIRPVYHK
jgi:hypothetical protein